MFPNTITAAGWLDGWDYRKSVVINGSVDGELTDYQLSVIVRKPTYMLFYNGGADQVHYSIGVATGDNLDAPWTKYSGNPVLTYSGSGTDELKAKDPCVVLIDGIFYMYYDGESGANTFTINLATSQDGITWTRYASNPVIPLGAGGQFDDYHMMFPTVYDTHVVGAKRYRMVYSGHDGTNWRMGYAYSADGLSWTKGGMKLDLGTSGQWDDYNVGVASNIVYKDGTYYMQYGGDDHSRAPQENWQVGLVTFTDFEGVWTKYAGNPIIPANDACDANEGVLTGQTNTGTKVVTIVDTSGFVEDQPVWLVTGDPTDDDEFNYVDTIDSGTQITLKNNTIRNYPATTSWLLGWDSGSISPKSLSWDGSQWVAHCSAFQPYTYTIIRECSYVATSADGISYSINMADNPPIPFEYGGATQWDEHSAENPTIYTGDAGKTLFANGDCEDDFSDIRFTADDGTTLLDYNIESYVSGQYAYVTINVPTIPESPSSELIYFYYGNALATDASDPDSTYLFYDGFDDDTWDAAKWVNENTATVSESDGIVQLSASSTAWRGIHTVDTFGGATGGVIATAKMKTAAGGDGSGFALATRIDGYLGDTGALVNGTGQNYVRTANNGTYTTTNTAVNDLTDYNIQGIAWNDVAVKYSENGGTLYTHTTNIPDQAMYLYFFVYTGTTDIVYVDWVAVSKYTENPPTIAPGVIQVTTDAATSIASTSAILNATIDNLGSDIPTERGFEWGTTTGVYTDDWTETGTYTVGAYDYELSGLTEDTEYFYRAKVYGSNGWGYGGELSFTTTTTIAPTVSTSAATSVSYTTAQINGNLTNLGSAASVVVSFEYGLTNAYGSTVVGVESPLGATGTFHAHLSGLTADTEYHYRAKAVGDGTTNGNDGTFTTDALVAPSVSTSAATNVLTTTATMNGNLTNLGSDGSVVVSFEYGLTIGYGSTAVATESPLGAIGTFHADLIGLAEGRTYHFRAKAVGDGTVYGSDRTFTTSTTPVTPPDTSRLGHNLILSVMGIVLVGVMLVVLVRMISSAGMEGSVKAVIAVCIVAITFVIMFLVINNILNVLR